MNVQRRLRWLAEQGEETYQILLLGVVFSLIPVFVFQAGRTYVSRLFILVLFFSILAYALNIVFGHTNQLYLFLGALTGLGAYGTMILSEALEISPWLTLVPSALLIGGLGLIVSYIAARRRFTVIIIAILTLALQLGIIEILAGLREYTGGTTGLRYSGLEAALLQNTGGVSPHTALYYTMLAVFLAVVAFYSWLRNSKYGLAFDVIRQDEIAAASTGIDIIKLKAIAGFLAAFIIGFVGPFYAQLHGLILPSMFEFVAIDVLVLIMLMIGGLRTLLGPVIGASIIIYTRELLHGAGQWQIVAFGALLVVLFLFFREGLIPFISSQVQRLSERSA